MIKIERGIKIPAISRGSNVERKSKYPFNKMLVGDSFFVQASARTIGWSNTKQTTAKMSCVNAAARTYRNFANMSFQITCRTVPRGIRVWRTR